ncbi:MAG: TIGR01906 family membrane protein [Clostridiaceae bacterium]
MKKINLVEILLAISSFLLVISFSIKIAINFKAIYYKDITYLNIEQDNNMKYEEIKQNYDNLIEYLVSDERELELPSFKTSENGRIHFEEVKNIIKIFNNIFYISLFITIVLNIIFKKNYIFLLINSILLVVVPFIILLFVYINYDFAFDLFHKIFFNNDFWIFDPGYDPVINILPQNYFLHELLFILFIILISSLISLLIYFFRKKKVNR